MHENIETRLARLEEAVVSVKGDTRHLRTHFDDFQRHYWLEIVRMTGRMAGMSAVVSIVAAVVTAAVVKALHI